MKFSNIYYFVVLFLILASFTTYKISKARIIHQKIVTIDSHIDTPLNLLNEGFDIGVKHDADECKIDIPRMENGNLDAAFFAVFTNQRTRTTENTQFVYERANELIDSVHNMIKKHQDKLVLATSSKDVAEIESMNKIAVYIGMENGFPLGKDISRVEEFYNKGVRYITLAHTSNNDICDSSTDEEGEEHNGLSDFGYKVVKEMNRLRMIIDVSHISDKAFYDVLETTSDPVIASHSSVRSLCNHPRNLSDSMIIALAKNGGVIQICIYGAYISPEDTTTQNYKLKQELKKKYNGFIFKDAVEREQAWSELDIINSDYPPVLPTIKQAVDHIDYVVNLVGIDYVGIGSDFDGGGGLADCRDVSDFPLITEELYRRGYSEQDIAKIWGGNFLRVFQEIESN